MNDRSKRWSPYVIGGVGTYTFDSQHFSSFRANHFGLQGGVGFEVRPPDPDNRTYFFEMRYLGIPPGGVVPITIGMRY